MAGVRKFVYDGREMDDPNPLWTVDEVRQNMANFFIELSNAKVESIARDEDTIYTFTPNAGRKGGDGRDWSKVADEMCVCGHKKSEHLGVFPVEGHGACTYALCICPKFKWEYFMDKDGNKI